jgi:hypothetical protein
MCEGPFSQHGHRKPRKSGMTHFHPTSPFCGVVVNDAFGAFAAGGVEGEVAIPS